MEANARANQLSAILVRWADGKQLAIAPQKSRYPSHLIPITSDTHQSRLHPQLRIGDAVGPLNRTPKILGVTLDTHLNFVPHARDCFERVSRALNIMKALAGSSWGFTTETLVATHKANVRPILNYAGPIWFTHVSSSHLDKLEVIQNKTLRVATGCPQKAAASCLKAETGVLPLRAHLELCWQQFYASALQPLHPSHLIVTSPPTPSGLGTTAHSKACESEATTLTQPPSPHRRSHQQWYLLFHCHKKLLSESLHVAQNPPNSHTFTKKTKSSLSPPIWTGESHSFSHQK